MWTCVLWCQTECYLCVVVRVWVGHVSFDEECVVCEHVCCDVRLNVICVLWWECEWDMWVLMRNVLCVNMCVVMSDWMLPVCCGDSVNGACVVSEHVCVLWCQTACYLCVVVTMWMGCVLYVNMCVLSDWMLPMCCGDSVNGVCVVWEYVCIVRLNVTCVLWWQCEWGMCCNGKLNMTYVVMAGGILSAHPERAGRELIHGVLHHLRQDTAHHPHATQPGFHCYSPAWTDESGQNPVCVCVCVCSKECVSSCICMCLSLSVHLSFVILFALFVCAYLYLLRFLLGFFFVIVVLDYSVGVYVYVLKMNRVVCLLLVSLRKWGL